MLNSPQNPFQFLTTPWGNLPVSAGSEPTGAFGSTIPELDKRIAELKTVEQWLTLNLNLLKTTIQGMEIQRGTLAAIESFSGAFSQPTSQEPGAQADQKGAAQTLAPGAEQAAWWWNSMQNQFNQMLQAAQTAGSSMGQGASTGSAASGGSSGYAANPISPEPTLKAEK